MSMNLTRYEYPWIWIRNPHESVNMNLVRIVIEVIQLMNGIHGPYEYMNFKLWSNGERLMIH